MNPLISIIIPTYNRAHLIGETLDSILAQTYTNWECIIVDDGSMDNTKSLIDKYVGADSRFSYYYRPETLSKGASSCRNYGFELSRGEYINWFDSDDLMLKNNLEVKVNYFQNNPEFDFLYSGFSYFNNSEIFFDKLSVFKSENILDDLVSNKVKINTLSIIWKKNFLLGRDLFNEKIFKGEELEFYIRMFSEGEIKYGMLSESLCLVRLHDDSNRILNSYSDYNKIVVDSFYEARKIIHRIVLRQQCTRATYITAVNFYLKAILFSISNKDFNAAYINLLFLKSNRFDNSINLRFQHYRLMSILFLLKLTNLKGYDFLKKHLKIK